MRQDLPISCTIQSRHQTAAVIVCYTSLPSVECINLVTNKSCDLDVQAEIKTKPILFEHAPDDPIEFRTSMDMTIYSMGSASVVACQRRYVRNDILDDLDWAVIDLCARPCDETYQALKRMFAYRSPEFEDGEPILSPMYGRGFGFYWRKNHLSVLKKFKRGKNCPLLN
jgi:hypothetical protein